MKNIGTIILTVISIATITLTSCTKEEPPPFADPEKLAGTTWKSDDYGSGEEYALLEFVSTSIVEGWVKQNNQEIHKDWSGTYTIADNTITLSYDGVSTVGIMVGDVISLAIDDKTLVFKRQ